MNLNQQKIFFRLSKISLLLVYIPFFIVQGFYNLDTPARNNNQTVSIRFKQQVVSHTHFTFLHSDNSTGKGAKIRLSKRFQQENTPIVVPPAFNVAAYLIKANVFHTYPDPLLPSSHLLANKLRGPPAIV